MDEEFIDVLTHDASPSETVNTNSPDPAVYRDIEVDVVLNDPNFKPPKLEYDSIGEFCFESDELALKGNADYKNLLEAIVVLEAQRAKAVKDLERLQLLQEEALSDPFSFVERIRRKEVNFPVAQKIHPVPTVDWGKYAISGNPSAFERRQISEQQTLKLYRNSNKKAKLHGVNNEDTQQLTRSWTPKDRSRLKELLKEFPPEEVEVLRWTKISNAIGSHTPFEVAFQVHEQYGTFISDVGDKLGKKPNLNEIKKNGSKTSNVEKDCTLPQESTQNYLHETHISDDEDISLDLQDTTEYQELMLLKKVLREKVAEESNDKAQHVGYKCCRCHTEPIVGTRWHCIDCRPPVVTDFCEDCAECMYETRQHTSEHRLEKQVPNKGFLDRDYMHFLGSDYNYLDPNYMPAT